MKILKNLQVLFFIVCTMIMTLNLTSCSKDDDVSTIITYTAKGTMSSSSDDAFGAMFAISDYTEAITKGLGSYYFDTEKDTEVISVCDVVYQRHRKNHPNWNGHIEIEKTKTDSSGKVVMNTIIKTYKYE